MTKITLDDQLDLLRLRLGDLCIEALKQDRFDRVAIVLWRNDKPAANCIVGNHTSIDEVRTVLLDNHYRFPDSGKRDFSTMAISMRNMTRRAHHMNRLTIENDHADGIASLEKRLADRKIDDREREQLGKEKDLVNHVYRESLLLQTEAEMRFKEREERDHPVEDDIMVLLGRIMELQDKLEAVASAIGGQTGGA